MDIVVFLKHLDISPYLTFDTNKLMRNIVKTPTQHCTFEAMRFYVTFISQMKGDVFIVTRVKKT